MPKLEALLFDAIETCLSLEPIGRRLPEVGLASDELELWFSCALRSAFALEISGTFEPFKEVLCGTLETLAERRRGAAPDRNQVLDLVQGFSSLPMHADVAPAFELARRRGLKTVVVSNGALEVSRAAFRAAQLEPLVDAFASVDEVRRYKPAREVYELAAAKAGTVPASAALLAAHDWDVHGAKAAGLRTGYVRRKLPHVPSFMHAPDVAADSLLEAVEALLRTD